VTEIVCGCLCHNVKHRRAVLLFVVDVINCLLKAMETQLKETQKLADMYREQVIGLEDKLARIREEGDIGKELFKVSPVF